MQTLYYVADPMCSWCYGFAPEWARIRAALPAGMAVRMVMGGLAADADAPMPASMRAFVEAAWRSVAAATGARFNHAFWTDCKPRRSTFPACRAVLAAGLQGEALGEAMFATIQRGYYLEARNPSDLSTLHAFADELAPALDAERFRRDVGSVAVENRLRADLVRRDGLGVTGYPSLVLDRGEEHVKVLQGYAPAATVLSQLARLGSD